jgi:hypothetical protein
VGGAFPAASWLCLSGFHQAQCRYHSSMTTSLDTPDSEQRSAKSAGWSKGRIVLTILVGLPLFVATAHVIKTDVDMGVSAAQLRDTVADTSATQHELYDRAHADKKFEAVLPQMTLQPWEESHYEADYQASLKEDAFGWLYQFMPGTKEMLKVAKEADATHNGPVEMKALVEFAAFMQVQGTCELIDQIKAGKPEEEMSLGGFVFQQPKNLKAQLQYCDADPAVYEPILKKLDAKYNGS